MKKVLWGLAIIITVLLVVVLYRTITFKPVVYEVVTDHVRVETDLEIFSEALTYQTISHKPEMIDQEAFLGFHQFLRKSFPLMDSLLQKEVFNRFSLMYHWPGSNPELEPVILMAHMDVVPVEYATRDEWDFGAFSGEITDEFIYGRGTLDDKVSLIAICSAVESMLNSGERPERGIYLCFGHDEEIGGFNGAKVMAEKLEERGVKAWMVLDETGLLTVGIVPGIEDTVALIGTSEKGYLSIELTVDLPGGHSSMPEKQNSLSVLIKAVDKLQENPLPNRITDPIDGFMKHIGPNLPSVQKMAFANTWLFKPLIISKYQESGASAAVVTTTQVTTIMNAGIKDNVVPSRARAVVNYRLLPGDMPEDIVKRAVEVVNDTNVHIKVYNFQIPPSPVSDYDTEQFKILASGIRSVNPNALVSPYLVLMASDSRHFYRISDHVYRFTPVPINKEDLSRIHGINERISIEGYRKAVDFYASFISSL